MIKRTLYFGNNAYLHTKDKQLLVEFADKDKPQATVPIEDIGVVILDAYQLTISQKLITNLLHNNVALITCDERHMPQGLLLNLEGNTLQQERFNSQINVSLPLKKNLWQQTIKAKIRNQSALLSKLSGNTMSKKHNYSENGFQNMLYWEQSVRSGDPDNYEGRAAAFYWKNIFSDNDAGNVLESSAVDYKKPNIKNFKRGRFESAPNNLFNYGYAILRAIVARSLVASGLLPTLGIHHHNKYNAYALADDIMEPYRPYVDEIVFSLVEKYYSEEWEQDGFELTPEIKKELLKIATVDVSIADTKSPLMNAVQRTTTSLNECYMGNSRTLLYPTF
ncbi:MAG: type II CRISPR-associated endonuclease Cas1 [Bacteroidota bacterium]|nr:type II CRISPR-associated endonuclease Cas1 [Bacteroidota bacterium]